MDTVAETALIAELEDDNRRLRRLLEDQGTSRELRHRSRNMLAVLRTIIRRSSSSGRHFEDYVDHLEDRLISIGRTQAAADALGFLDLHMLIADELLFYTLSEGETLSIGGPVVRLEPRAGQVLGLAIHELAVNAVEHGAVVQGGRIRISWDAAPGGSGEVLALVWRESGLALTGGPAKQGFGWDVLTRMLAYDLKAHTDIALLPDGLRCEIRFPLGEEIKLLRAADSQPG